VAVKEQDLIASLVDDLRPVRRTPRIGRSLALFGGAAAAGVALLTRAGTALEAADVLSIAALAGVAASASVAAVASSIPGRRGWQAASAVAMVLVALWAGALVMRAMTVWPSSSLLWGVVPWPKCFAFSWIFGAVPAWVLVRSVQHGWSLQPRLSLALATAAGIAAGAVAVALECPSVAPLHVLLGHALPVTVAAAAGAALSRRERSRQSAL
jgi:hypothetical protein